MKKLAHFFESDKGKRVKNLIIGVGASVVLVGALFKIQHWPGAGPMLIIGMSVEAFIFALQGLLPPHSDYYWEKIYPGIEIAPDLDENYQKGADGVAKKKGSVTEELDDMLEEGGIDSELITRLGDNMKRLGDNISRLSDISDTGVVTDEFNTKTKEASDALGQMKEAYVNATDAVSQLSAVSSDAGEYQEQMRTISKNLSSLNSMYETELQDSQNHLKALNTFYGNLTEASNQLEESVGDARKYKEQMATLAENLSSLNSVYGNMLSAMGAPKTNPGSDSDMG